MATWVRQGTGTAPSQTDADLVGEYQLDNATAPADFDPAAVNSVRCQWTVTGSGFGDDSWNDDSCALITSGGTEISQHPGAGGTGLQNTSVNNDHTDSTGIPAGLSVAEWESARVRGDGTTIPNEWVDWIKSKGPDGSTLTISALTVTIDYTPSSSTQNLTPSTLSVSPSFPSASVTNQDQFLTPSALSVTTSFPAASIAVEAAYSLVQAVTGLNDGTTTSVTINLDQQATAGNLLVATSFMRPGTKPSVHSDWDGELWAVEDTTNGDWLISYYKVADGTETSMTVNTASGGGPGDLNVTHITEYSGFSGTPTLDVTNTNGPVDSTTVSSGTTGTLADATSLAVAGFSMRTTGQLDSTFDSYTNSFTEDIEAVNQTGSASTASYAAVAHLATSSTSGQETTVTVSDSGRLMGGIATFYDVTAGDTLEPSTLSVTASFGTATLIQEQFLTPSLLTVTANFGTANIFSDLFIEPTPLTISTTLPQHQLDQTFASNLVSLTVSFGTSTIKEIQAIQPSLLTVALTLHAAQLNQNVNASTHQVITSFGTSTLGLYLQSATIGVSPTLGNSEISSTADLAPATVTPTVAFGASEVEGVGTTQDVQPAPLTVVFSFPAGNLTATATLAPSVVSLTSSFGTAVLGIALQPAVLTVTSAFGNAQLDFGVSDAVLTISPSFPTATIVGDQGLTPDVVNVTVVFPFGNLANAGTPLTPSDTEGQGIAQEMCAARSLPGDLDWLGCMNALANTNGKDKLGVLTTLGATPGADLLLALEQLANDGQGPADFNELMRRWAESGNF